MSCPYLDRDGFSYKSKNEILKLNLYADAGVREYWIVDPTVRNVAVYCLEDGTFRPQSHTFQDTVKVNIFEDFSIDFQTLDIDFPPANQNRPDLWK